jgi:hypothetical protein
MENSPSTSLLTILSLYASLRRSGSTEREAQAKLRGLASQLSSADRRVLVTSVNDWESKHQGQLEQNTPGKDHYRATMVISPDAAQMYGESRYDQLDRATTDTALKPLRQIVSCPSCGKKNDSAKMMCAYCGKPLQPTQVTETSDAVPPTWFGPTSKLVLSISGASQPFETLVYNVLTLGRYTPEDTLVDIDLSAYQADVYGVSRLHASIKRHNNSLTLTDMQSKNHTFLNENELKDSEVCPLKSGDKIRLGNLGISITFKHSNR